MNTHQQKMPLFSRSKKIIVFSLLILITLFLCYWSLFIQGGKLKLDKELSLNNAPLNSSTQSLNRYHSNLRNLNKIALNYDASNQRINVTATGENTALALHLENIDARFLIPMLHYPHDTELDDFDAFNLMLNEFARSSVRLSNQTHNELFAYFYPKGKTLDGSQEYFIDEQGLRPNPDVLPTRLNLVNNCLSPGLWELSASDSAGEMYHAWFDLPLADYFDMIRDLNNIEASDLNMRWLLRYRENAEDIKLQLAKLRQPLQALPVAEASIAMDKAIRSFSSQDSRRKMQKGFYQVVRNNNTVTDQINNYADLTSGDIFKLYSFIPPGVYNADEFKAFPYDPDWNHVEFNLVEPLTAYNNNASSHDSMGYLEIKLFSTDRSRAIILGNIPISLLVFQEDYAFPAFGVGVPLASELIERRYLRFSEGPKPHYAYLAKHQEGEFFAINNHEEGLEQVFLRPVVKGEQVFLKITLVAYERIIDTLELNIPLDPILTEKLRTASQQYERPMFMSYSDSNFR